MQQQWGGDYPSSAYYPHFSPSPPVLPNPNPNTNPADLPTSTAPYASAPPYNYPAYSHAPDPAPTYPPDQQQQHQPGNYPHLQPPYHPYESPQPTNPYPAYEQGVYSDGNSGRYAGDYRVETSGYVQDYYGGQNGVVGGRCEPPVHGEDVYVEGVHAYDGGSVEPYGARGTKSASSWAMFDDYGRAVGAGGSQEWQGGGGGVAKVVRAVPKAESQQDVNQGVQKFRGKLLPEGAGSPQDVLCQVGLDGIRMLEPSTSRTLRIYPLDNITRWQVLDSSIFAFWAKASVDPEPRRIRLQSNSYTSNTILDTVTAASIQYKEMGGKDIIGRSNGAIDSGRPSEPLPEKKKGLMDWMTMIKPMNEEKDHWVPDAAVSKCTSCGADFSAFVRRHHCRNCGDIFCDKCTNGRIALTADEQAQPVRVCDACLAEVTQRLSHAKELASKPTTLHNHEDLAKKIQDEMERNRKASGGSKSSSGSGRRTREVACPTCTVHLQVQVPMSGSETVECGVCQNPFLVTAG